MLRNSSRYKQRKQNRQYERIRLNLLAPEANILPYQFIRPSPEPLGLDETVPSTDYEQARSTLNIYNTTTPTNAIDWSDRNSPSTNNEDTSDGSVSVYTIKMYNRLEGRWETRRPNHIQQPQRFSLWQDSERERLSTEPHPSHPTTDRPYYVEYHRLRVYNNESDSSFNLSSTSSDTTTFTSYDSTDEDNKLNSEHIAQLFQGSNPNYWPDYGHHSHQSLELEYDSVGDFPLTEYSRSGTTLTRASQSPTADYATQDEYYTPNLPACYDNTRDTITGAHNPTYLQHINDITYGVLALPRTRRNHPAPTPPSTSSSSTSVDSTDRRSRDDEYISDPPELDATLDPVTFRYNPHYWRSINGHTTAPSRPTPLSVFPLTTSTFPLSKTTSDPAPLTQHAQEPRITTTTSRITTTETRPHTGSINPLPTFVYRQHLPLLAARKSTYDSGTHVRHVIKTPAFGHPGKYKTAHLRATKCVSFKTTRPHTLLHTRSRSSVGATPDTTASSTYGTPTKRRKYKHTIRRTHANRRLFLGLVVNHTCTTRFQTRSECVDSPTFQYKIY